MKFMEYSEVTCGHRSGVASICAFWGVFHVHARDALPTLILSTYILQLRL